MRKRMSMLGVVLVVLVWLALAILIAAEIVPGPPAAVTASADPTYIPADGASTSTITAIVKDASENPVADGTVVTFTTSLGSLGSTAVTKFTISGVATATLTSATTPGIAIITAMADSITDTTTVEFTRVVTPDLAIQLTTHPGIDSDPDWSPCDQIVFKSNRVGVDAGWPADTTYHSDIWVMNPDGAVKSPVTDSPWRDGYGPSWSPDCTQVVFCRTDQSYTSADDDIWIVDAEGGEESAHEVFTSGDDQCPDWSPDGTKIAFTGAVPNWQMCTINTAGGELTQITDFPFDCQWPDWSPDGSKIAFEHFSTPNHSI